MHTISNLFTQSDTTKVCLAKKLELFSYYSNNVGLAGIPENIFPFVSGWKFARLPAFHTPNRVNGWGDFRKQLKN